MPTCSLMLAANDVQSLSTVWKGRKPGQRRLLYITRRANFWRTNQNLLPNALPEKHAGSPVRENVYAKDEPANWRRPERSSCRIHQEHHSTIVLFLPQITVHIWNHPRQCCRQARVFKEIIIHKIDSTCYLFYKWWSLSMSKSLVSPIVWLCETDD